MFTKNKLALSILAAIVLPACGGSGNGGNTENSNVTSNNTVSVNVVVQDKNATNVEGATVCVDMNNDLQCSTSQNSLHSADEVDIVASRLTQADGSVVISIPKDSKVDNKSIIAVKDNEFIGAQVISSNDLSKQKNINNISNLVTVVKNKNNVSTDEALRIVANQIGLGDSEEAVNSLLTEVSNDDTSLSVFAKSLGQLDITPKNSNDTEVQDIYEKVKNGYTKVDNSLKTNHEADTILGVLAMNAEEKNPFESVPEEIVQPGVNMDPEAKFDINIKADGVVEFINQSTDSESRNLKFYWKFGDAEFSSSNEINPTFTYAQNGIYKISLYVYNGVGFDAYERTITIDSVQNENNRPVALFTKEAILNGEGQVIGYNFTNKSSDLDNDKLTYTWEFGDGEESTDTNPSHEYKHNGTYYVHLMAYDGRQKSEVYTEEVKIAGLDVGPINFYYNLGENDLTLSLCADITSFEGAEVTYQWDFGDGTTLDSGCVKHQYNDYGSYDVTLIATDGTVTRQITKRITLEATNVVIPNFTFSIDAVENSPRTYVLTAELADNADKNVKVDYFWSVEHFAYTSKQFVHTFSKPGSYPVELYINYGGLYSEKLVQVINVPEGDDKPYVEKSMSLGYVANDNKVTFEGVMECLGDAEFTLDFGDGSPLNVLYSPTDNTDKIQKVSLSHTYENKGTYNVKLQGTCNGQALPEVLEKITVPTTDIDADFAWQLDEDFTVRFFNKTVASGEGDTTYVWDFGDGTESNATNPVKKYLKSGSYRVTLVAKHGSQESKVASKAINVVSHVAQFNHVPVAKFETKLEDPTKYNVIRFVDKSYDEDNDFLEYTWNFGDGNFSNWHSPIHTYEEDGTYDVTLTVFDGRAYSKEYLGQVVVSNNVQKDVLTMGYSTQGLDVSFSNLSTCNELDSSNVSWDFGDGSISNENNPLHTYKEAGDYVVTLNSPCLANGAATKQISVHKEGTLSRPQLNFSWDLNEDYTISFTNTSLNLLGQNVSYEWDFGNGNKTTELNPQNVEVSYGASKVTLRATGDNFEPIEYSKVVYRDSKHDDIVSAVVTQAPKASFRVNEICGSRYTNSIYVENTSTDPDREQLKYLWDLGNGEVLNESAQSFNYTYEQQGSYDVNLYVKDILYWSVAEPYKMGVSSFENLEGMNVSFHPIINDLSVEFINHSFITGHAPSNEEFTYNWDFGDGVSSTEIEPKHVYEKPGKYLVSLVATYNGYEGKKSYDVYSEQIEVKANEVNTAPKSLFTYTEQESLRVMFNNKSTDIDNDELTYYWNFGDGNTSSEKSPVHTYAEDGNYEVTLVVSDGHSESEVYSRNYSVGAQGVDRDYPIVDFEEEFSYVDGMNNSYLQSKIQIPNNGDEIVDIFWKFSDDNKAVGLKNVNHTFTSDVVKTAKLFVKTRSGVVRAVSKYIQK